ncbi:MAG: hypothetical protein UR82_C0031G0009 [Candidatus Moranbacteria bacterium GW2011_GWF1_35_5]|nr:MAG: hypothetical protein UR82_C0031G0009 [Candidatus Moranbacteria bacterium GW2011_GWF1_35_5]KKP82810.1 MAG: hypothetical protein UR83_C0044G0008 [Candidatus Moranbacteria bacterium GW2011_GWF2_35_54]
MKKQMRSVLAMVVGIFFLCGSAMAASTVKYDAIDIPQLGAGTDHMLTSVSDDNEGNVVVTLTNVRFTPIGVDTKGENLTTADAVVLYSGIMDAKGIREPFVVAKVINGKATFRIPNSARVAGVPVVEHFWGRSADGRLALVHDPADPFVVSNNGDLNTLAIGIVMYSNAPTVSLKPFGKLDQGKHPELANK